MFHRSVGTANSHRLFEREYLPYWLGDLSFGKKETKDSVAKTTMKNGKKKWIESSTEEAARRKKQHVDRRMLCLNQTNA